MRHDTPDPPSPPAGRPPPVPLKPRGRSQARGHATAAAIDLPALRAAYEAGASTVDLAVAHGLARTTIRDLLERAGCTVRTVAQAHAVRERASYVRAARPTPASGRRIVLDVFGAPWRVTHTSPTGHGFAVVRGIRVPGGRGSPAVILTQPLAAHLERHRLAPRLLDLPLGQSVIVRLRQRLAQDFVRETAAWWQARRDDLDRLPPGAFAARHGVPRNTAMVMRRRLCGPRPGRRAWLDAAARALLLSDRPAAEVATLLGKKRDLVYQLRSALRRQAAAGPGASHVPAPG
ncbi:hypothetical protein [Methylobacterium sp. Leaf102]|uniref:hypothetical protein n=1 Tax=Methylobacterium sp. Leaf102 TaxID=1736253 RepID=UPI000B055FB5|nr:hypothetical protein [Methylobacterium sp. Leaf102]